MEEENDAALKRAQFVANKLLQTCDLHKTDSVRIHIEKAYLIGLEESKKAQNENN